ncbi:DUF397 domain-containing protein [Streptomyces sp. MP131-18]|uniref:DUF397 domain-containing protein n=1 Tax=Streptomyces sp. MP131-18 TaxID=1857892 RepID=UPI00097C06FB|nr:DUF397 domain-containing protein [Streptomyces sp. MP131-18]ONK12737.1 hypothetical protein STBA_34890 [Streptomyces sp. MP131-18]
MNSELVWFKSSHSTGDGGDCVEIAFDWRKSSYSTGDGGECVEVAPGAHAVHVRDSKDTTRSPFTVSTAAWSAFVGFTASR